MERADRPLDWKWYLMLGMVLALAGLTVLTFTSVTSTFSPGAFGAMLLLSGAAHLFYSFKFRSWGWVMLHLATSILQIVTGTLLIGFPVAGLAALTLVVSVYLLVGGLFRIFFGLTAYVMNAQWIVVSGFISALMGLVVWAQWPLSSAWFFGAAIGIDLVLDGAQWFTRAFEIKNHVIDIHPHRTRVAS